MPLTTTLSELNRLYGAYYEASCGTDRRASEDAWFVYLKYMRRYNDERGLGLRTRIR